MNLLQRALIEKAGHDNGFEHVLPTLGGDQVLLGSARHGAEVRVRVAEPGFVVALERCQSALPVELTRSFPDIQQSGKHFSLPDESALARWLRRAAALAQALPNQAVANFETEERAELAVLEPASANNTEVQRLVRQRVGQQAFRQAMLDYWGGACAVTGVALPQVLRTSHAKAWALSDKDGEWLDVYKGFLLSANLDAMFDAYLVRKSTGSKFIYTYVMLMGMVGRVRKTLRRAWVGAFSYPVTTGLDGPQCIQIPANLNDLTRLGISRSCRPDCKPIR